MATESFCPRRQRSSPSVKSWPRTAKNTAAGSERASHDSTQCPATWTLRPLMYITHFVILFCFQFIFVVVACDHCQSTTNKQTNKQGFLFGSRRLGETQDNRPVSDSPDVSHHAVQALPLRPGERQLQEGRHTLLHLVLRRPRQTLQQVPRARRAQERTRRPAQGVPVRASQRHQRAPLCQQAPSSAWLHRLLNTILELFQLKRKRMFWVFVCVYFSNIISRDCTKQQNKEKKSNVKNQLY